MARVAIGLGLALIVAIVVVAIDMQHHLNRPLTVPAEGVIYEVGPGSGLIRIAADLEARGVLERSHYLVWIARWRGEAEVRAGRYRLTRNMTPLELLDSLHHGDVVQYSLTLPEGIRFTELRQRLAVHEAIVHDTAAWTAADIMASLGHPDQAAEGRFFPDTYFFPAGTSDLAFLDRAYRAMQRVLAEEWQERAPGLPYTSPDEVLVMASIIEKETGRAEERPQIAGVFVRRLQRGMRLQSDPTVIYGLGERYDGRLHRRDLRADSPYNTYRRHGLPPTPIAMPGRAAIHAALHPTPGDELYFVSRGDGSHVFSANLVAHERAVRRYQLGQE